MEQTEDQPATGTSRRRGLLAALAGILGLGAATNAYHTYTENHPKLADADKRVPPAPTWTPRPEQLIQKISPDTDLNFIPPQPEPSEAEAKAQREKYEAANPQGAQAMASLEKATGAAPAAPKTEEPSATATPSLRSK